MYLTKYNAQGSIIFKIAHNYQIYHITIVIIFWIFFAPVWRHRVLRHMKELRAWIHWEFIPVHSRKSWMSWLILERKNSWKSWKSCSEMERKTAQFSRFVISWARFGLKLIVEFCIILYYYVFCSPSTTKCISSPI